MSGYSQVEMDTDWYTYSALVDSTIKELCSRKGNQEGLHFFNSNFHIYTQAVQPVAEALERKYSTLVSKKVHGELKELLQDRFEQGLNYFHLFVTDSKFKDMWGLPTDDVKEKSPG